MSKQVEEIRAEIERLIKNPRLDKDYNPAYKAGLRDLRKFIDALPKEDGTADVQEAAKNYADEKLAGNNRELAQSGHTRHFKMGHVCFAGYEIEQAFADGAEWQAVKDGECHEESFEDGAKWERERLMKEAVDGTMGYGPHLQRPIVILEELPKIWDGSSGNPVSAIIIKKEK